MKRHLFELRNRLFLVAGVLIITATLAYMYRDPIITALMAPLDGRQLQYLTPGGGFKFIFSVIFFVGLAAAIPLLIQQIYAFFRPALPERVRSRSGWLLFWSCILLATGMAFGYVYAVPGALNFLYGFADSYIVSALTADAYLDFIIKYTLGIGLIFQIPLIMMLIHWIKPQRPTKLLRFERWVILLAFILAAIITPTPDPVNQAIVAVPIILVYQAGLIAVCLSIWRDKRVVRKQAKRHVASLPAASAPAPVPAVAISAATTTPAAAATSTTPPPVRSHSTRQQPPRRSIDGMTVRSQAPRQFVRTAAQPPVSVPRRPATVLPRAVRPIGRQPLSIDGVSRMVSV